MDKRLVMYIFGGIFMVCGLYAVAWEVQEILGLTTTTVNTIVMGSLSTFFGAVLMACNLVKKEFDLGDT